MNLISNQRAKCGFQELTVRIMNSEMSHCLGRDLNNISESEGGYNGSLFTEDPVLDVILILCDALLLVR